MPVKKVPLLIKIPIKISIKRGTFFRHPVNSRSHKKNLVNKKLVN